MDEAILKKFVFHLSSFFEVLLILVEVKLWVSFEAVEIRVLEILKLPMLDYSDLVFIST